MLQELISNFPDGQVVSNGTEFLMECPSCGPDYTGQDRRKFYIGIAEANDDFPAHCKRCGLSSRGKVNLRRLLGLKGAYAPRNVLMPKSLDVSENIELVDLFSNEGLPGLRYLHDRGIRDDQIIEHSLSYCNAGRFRDRIMIPIINTKRVVLSYTGRAIHDDARPKYLNTRGSGKYPFNLCNIMKKCESVIIMEGIFDVISSCMRNAIAVMGKSLSKDIQFLIASSFRTAIVWLDVDANKDSVKMARDLHRLGLETYVVFQFEGKDPGDCPHPADEIGRKILYSDKLFYDYCR